MATEVTLDKMIIPTSKNPVSLNSGVEDILKFILTGGDPRTMTGKIGIDRRGEKIIVPEGMSLDVAIEALRRQQQAEETLVSIHHNIPCYPLDGINALWLAFNEKFGHVDLRGQMSFFGERPPNIIKIETGPGKFEQVPFCRIAPPVWEGGYLQPVVQSPTRLAISGQVKRKFETLIRELLELTEKIVKQQSIYKGRAISMDLAYLNEEDTFDPDSNAPKFMDLSNATIDNLILNTDTQFALTTNLFVLLRQSEACIKNNIPLKHGALLSGSYGTGKTMTARVMGKLAIENGWTYIYLKSSEYIAKALEMAVLYAPAVLFCEDVDQVVSGKRDDDLNVILNTLDGVDTKNHPIITVLTTNNADNIHPAFMRAGRIDTIINYEAPDEETAIRFVQLYAKDINGKSLLAPDVDLNACGKAMAGMIPAFIAEAMQKAKKAAIDRHGENIAGMVVTDDIVTAARVLKDHIKRADLKKEDDTLTELTKALKLVGKVILTK